MKYLKKFEGFDTNREWVDMSPEERKETSINSIDSVVDEIKKEFSEANDKSDLAEMIVWYEDKYGDIPDEDKIINQLVKEYGL